MIRTREFAKIKFSRSTESLASSVQAKNGVGAAVSVDAVAGDIDVISLSSCEDKPVVTPKTEPKPRKKRERKPRIVPATPRRVRKWTTPLKANYSRITDFFQKTKHSADIKATSETDIEPGVAAMEDSDVELIEVMSSSSSGAVKSAQSNATTSKNSTKPERPEKPDAQVKQVKVVLERMDMTPYMNGQVVPMNTRKRRIPSDQSKLDGFVDSKGKNDGYFDTYQQSSLSLPNNSIVRIESVELRRAEVKEEPMAIDENVEATVRSSVPLPDNSMVRIESVEMTRGKVKEEPMTTDEIVEPTAEPSVAIIISSPKHVSENEENDKNIENTTSAVLDHNNLLNVNVNEHNELGVCNIVATSEGASMSEQSSLLVAQKQSTGPSMSVQSDASSKNVDVNQNHTEKLTKSLKTKQKPPATAKKATKKKTVIVPSYKIIAGTNLAVDAFRYGDIESVQHYFLSHFHADHYIGLKKSFSHNLYLSEITGRLVETFIKVDRKYMCFMTLETPIIVDDIEVTALDANHCPGAIMFLFKLTTGKCILHTGDFRASPDMEEYPQFWNNSIDSIYLDTTYLSKKYAFQSQVESIAEVKSECNEFLKKKATVGRERCLIVCGAYKIGKEKVWMSIAEEFNFKVYIDKERRKAMQCLDDANVLSKLTPNPNEANIHVLPLGNISYQQMTQYLQYYNDTFNSLLAVRPSGWENRAKKPNYSSNVSLLGVQYSEHSSYNELERFVKYLQPKTVISTVPTSPGDLNKTTKVPAAWTNIKSIRPNREPHQPTIKDMFRKKEQSAKTDTTGTVTNNVDEEPSISVNEGLHSPSSNRDSRSPTSNTTIHGISSSTDYMP